MSKLKGKREGGREGERSSNNNGTSVIVWSDRNLFVRKFFCFFLFLNPAMSKSKLHPKASLCMRIQRRCVLPPPTPTSPQLMDRLISSGSPRLHTHLAELQEAVREDAAAQWIQANEALGIHTAPIPFLICAESHVAHSLTPPPHPSPAPGLFPYLLLFKTRLKTMPLE